MKIYVPDGELQSQRREINFAWEKTNVHWPFTLAFFLMSFYMFYIICSVIS